MSGVNIEDLEPSDDYATLLHQGKAFTGVAYEQGADGRMIAEVSYQHGQKSGITREWSLDGVLIREQSYAFDALHGPSREWYSDGARKTDAVYELGICVQETQYAADGSVASEFVLKADDPQFKTLEMLRTGSLGKALITHGTGKQ